MSAQCKSREVELHERNIESFERAKLTHGEEYLLSLAVAAHDLCNFLYENSADPWADLIARFNAKLN